MGEHDNKYIEVLAGKVALPDRMDCSLNEFGHRVAVYLEQEQHKPLPDNGLIALLCDAARLGWEHINYVEKDIASFGKQLREEVEP